MSPTDRGLEDIMICPLNVLKDEQIPIFPNSPSNKTKKTRPSSTHILHLNITTKVRRKPNLKRIRKKPGLLFWRNYKLPNIIGYREITKYVQDVHSIMPTLRAHTTLPNTSPDSFRISEKFLFGHQPKEKQNPLRTLIFPNELPNVIFRAPRVFL